MARLPPSRHIIKFPHGHHRDFAARDLPRPLDGLRAAVLRHDHQLRGPPGPQPSRQDAGNEIGWDSIQYGYITAAFQAAYAIGLLGAGRVMDRIGTRKGFAIAITVWSLAAIGHAAAASAFAFGIARAFLGLRRSGQFPRLHQDRGRVVPEKGARACDRHFQLGREYRSGDRAAGSALDGEQLGLAIGVHRHRRARIRLADFLARRLSQAARNTPPISARRAGADPERPAGSRSPPTLGRRCLPQRETWAFAIGKALTDPVWWFYLFWLPKYLQETFGLSLFQAIVPATGAVQPDDASAASAAAGSRRR